MQRLMNVDEAKDVCQDRSKWRLIVYLPTGKQTAQLYVMAIKGQCIIDQVSTVSGNSKDTQGEVIWVKETGSVRRIATLKLQGVIEAEILDFMYFE